MQGIYIKFLYKYVEIIRDKKYEGEVYDKDCYL